MTHVLIVDDEPGICWALEKLCRQHGVTTAVASSVERGLRAAGERTPDVLFLDVRLPGISGLDALPKFRETWPATRVVMMTAYGQLETAVDAVRKGAFEYLTKPFSLDHVEQVLERAVSTPRTNASGEPAAVGSPADALVGRSPEMQEVFRQIALVTASDACVHISGESGTGKELVARAIHRYSRRSAAPFVPVNLSAMSPLLAERELFGQVPGTATAGASRQGVFDQAEKGTIFLDEVTDVPQELQAKLLRTLEQREIQPLGAGRPHRIDARLISATRRPLPELLRAGLFRQDLYYRLRTFEISLPALRNRRSDQPLLAEHFLKQLGRPPELAADPSFLEELQRRRWPGNVREFRNAIEHAVILSRGEPLQPWHLPLENPLGESVVTLTGSPVREAVRQWALGRLQEQAEPTTLHADLLAEVEPPLFAAALSVSKQQVATAARLLGLHRTTLKRKLDDYGLQSRD